MWLVLAELINPKLANFNARNVRQLLDVQALHQGLEPDQQAIVRNVVQLASSSIPKLDFVGHVVMVSISRMKDLSDVNCAVLDKQLVQVKQHHAKSAVTNAAPDNNSELMVSANHVREEHTAYKVFSHLVSLVLLAGQHLKSAHHRLKSVPFQFVHLVPI